MATPQNKPGGELALEAMSEYSLEEMGRKTLSFVRRMMQNPEARAIIEARAAQIRAAQMEVTV